MPIKLIWTDAQDTQIRRLRIEGGSWDSIAAILGLTRWTVIERGRRIGAQRPPREFVPPPEDPAREPLPAGHVRSWGAINAGTVLEDEPYPLPIFPRLRRQKESSMSTVQAADARPFNAELVIDRLEEAGAALLALPGTGWSTKLRSSSLEIVRAAIENYGWTTKRIRPAVPSAAQITRMDEAMAWISLIPMDRYVLRRIVGARSLVHPITERHLFPWRRLGTAIGADHKAVQRWHAQGIDLVVAALNGGKGHNSESGHGQKE